MNPPVHTVADPACELHQDWPTKPDWTARCLTCRPPFTLPDDEAADLRIAHDTGWPTLLAHVTDLCDAYRAQGYVMGDLAHDGTLKAQAEAEEV